MTTPLPDPDQKYTSRVRLLPALLTLLATGSAVTQAVEVTFTHYRFTPTVTQSNADVTPVLSQTQMSEFIFYRRGVTIDRSLITVSGGGDPDANEGSKKLNDGDVLTKWYSATHQPVTFSFTEPTTVDAYNFATANDSLDRTPRRWRLEGSNDNTNWTLIDNRSLGDNAIPTALYTYRGVVSIGGGAPDLPVITNSFGTPVTEVNANGPILLSQPSIVLNGGASALKWNVTNSTGQSTLTPFPGSVQPASTGTAITPPSDGDTYYTFTTSNAKGPTGFSHKFRAVPGTTATARYVRFTGTALRGNGVLTQIGEFEFFNAGVKVPVQTVTNPTGDSGGNVAEVVASINDGNYGSKWLNSNNRPVIFDFGSSATFDSYQITTGNDASERDPVRWMLETSDDGTTWKTLEAVNNYPMPSERRTQTGKLPLSGTSVVWTGSDSATWDATATNWAPSGGGSSATSFRNNEPAFFNESSSVRDINIASAVSPSIVEVDNSGEPYSFSGSPIAGLGGLVKRGTGELKLKAANTFSGSIYALGGTLTAEHPNSLGAPDTEQRLELGGNGTLHVTSNLRTQRRGVIREGGATVNVESNAVFNKVGVLDFYGTLRKTGFGTLRLESYASSRSTAETDLIIDEGVVEFAHRYYPTSAPYPASTLKIVVNELGTLRFGASSPLGGHHTFTTLSTEQILVNEGGTFDITSNLTYFPLGTVGAAGAEQGRLALKGGTLTGGGVFEPVVGTADAQTTISALPSEQPSYITGSGELAINPGPLTLITEPGAVLDINRRIVGNYGFTKKGAGELIISGAQNTFTGASIPGWPNPPPAMGTVVSAGTLTLLNFAGSATGTSPVTIAAGATLQGTGFASGAYTINGTVSPGETFVPYSTLTLGSTTIAGNLKLEVDGFDADSLKVNGALTLDPAMTFEFIGQNLSEGLYTLISHTGPRTGTLPASFVAPAGYTLVYGANAISLVSNTASAYDVWSAGLSDTAPDADPDQDGIVNAIEFVLNSDGGASSPQDLPTVTRNANGDLVFTFVRRSNTGNFDPVVEYSTDLETNSWTVFTGEVEQDNTPSTGLITVTATIPASAAGPDGKVFARLRIDLF